MTKTRIIQTTQSNQDLDRKTEADIERRRFLKDFAYSTMGLMLGAGSSSHASERESEVSRSGSRAYTGRPRHPKRFAIGMFVQESNTFCPEMSGLARFRNMTLATGDDVVPLASKSSEFLGGMAKAATDLGISLYGTVAAEASPFGIVDREAYDYVRSVLFERLKNAPRIDGVLFAFHGGMVAETTMDPEGDLIETIRAIVGPDVPVCCTFDLHCKVSGKMIENGSAFFYNNENPHVDSFDRGVEAAQVCFRIASKEISPVMAMSKPGMIVPTLNVRPPTSGPLVAVFDKAFELERSDDRIININIGAGFPWQDVPEAGLNVVSVVDKDFQLAQDVADFLSEEIWRVRQEFIPNDLVDLKEAVARAVAENSGPTVLVDVADNPGDGTTMDSNAILREMLEQGISQAAVGCIRQPAAVQRCIDAGVGARIDLEVGCPYRVVGEPISMNVQVKSITDGTFEAASPIFGTQVYKFGRTTVVTHEGIDIILCERTGSLGNNFPDLFFRNGIDPRRRKILAIKTFQMYSEPHYREITNQFIQVDAPGQATPHLSRLAWKNIPRPVFPIDSD